MNETPTTSVASVSEYRQLPGSMRDKRACDTYAELAAPCDASVLEFVGEKVTQVDASGAAVLRSAMDLHLRRSAGNAVRLWEPKDERAWRLLHNLMGDLPTGASWTKTHHDGKTQVLTPEVLIPATCFEDRETALAAVDDGLEEAAFLANLSDVQARRLTQAGIVLTGNALAHPEDADCAGVVCVAIDEADSVAQLVVVDGGQRFCRSQSPQDELEAAVTSAAPQRTRDLEFLTALSRRGEDLFTLHLTAGLAHLRCLSKGDWRRGRASDVNVPGFIAAFRLTV